MAIDLNHVADGSRRSFLSALVAGGGYAMFGNLSIPFARNIQIRRMAGTPALRLAGYDLSSVGLVVREFGLAGRAAAFGLAGEATADGDWDVEPASEADFSTRLVVLLPDDPTRFNGTVVVEWLNVTSGQDMPIFWLAAHREIIRKGYAYVGVSVQKAGIDSDSGGLYPGGGNLKIQDPERYAGLSHPGDAYSYDIFSAAGEAVRRAAGNGILDGLVPQRIVAAGESQSAAFLTTYINAVDPMAKVYDGFFVHSRFGGAADIDGTRMGGSARIPRFVRFRTDLRVPVMAAITETDLIGAGTPGYHGARRKDGPNLRVWEIPGSSHGDNYLFGGAFMDSGLGGESNLLQLFAQPPASLAGPAARRFNPGMAHHYVVQAALAGLDNWIRHARAPRSFPPMDLAGDGEPTRIRRDALDIAVGGVRNPWVDVPTASLSGIGSGESFIARFGGSGEPFEAARLREIYPGGREDYLMRFRKALASAVALGAILPEDEAEILAVAALQFPVE